MTPFVPPARSWIERREARQRLLTGGRRPPSPSRMRALQAEREPKFQLARQVVGWIVLLVGVAGIVLPLTPALILIPAGVALIGRNHWTIRRTRIATRLLLRRAESWPGWLGSVGRVARLAERKFGNKLRERRLRAWERRRSNPSPGVIG